MRKCIRCGLEMIENYDVKVEGVAYGLEGIRYPVGSVEIIKYQIGFSLTSEAGILEVDST